MVMKGVLAVLERFSDWRLNISLGVAAFEAMHDALFPLIFCFGVRDACIHHPMHELIEYSTFRDLNRLQSYTNFAFVLTLDYFTIIFLQSSNLWLFVPPYLVV